MGQLRDKKIIQSQNWVDPNQLPIPPWDYDYVYPITVFEAVRRTMDNNSANLFDELESMYRLISEKQEIVHAGTPGSLMTWTGNKGHIGSLDVVRILASTAASRSHSKIPTEKAVGDALEQKASVTDLNAHSQNNTIHVTDVERARWNSLASSSSLQAHISNVTMHVTLEERTRWNSKANQSDFDNHIYSTNNPHNVTAHQAGTYTRREIDNFFENLRESFFNYVNISWDDRTSQAKLVTYHPANWNPNFVLGFGDPLPDVPANPPLTYFAIKPATDYVINETSDVLIYIKRPGLMWQEVGFASLKAGDMVIKYPETTMMVWVQGRFVAIFSHAAGTLPPEMGGGTPCDHVSWRPVVDETTGMLSWEISTSKEPPSSIRIVGKDAVQEPGKPGEGVAIGGDLGDVLVKISEQNYDTSWRSLKELMEDLVLSGDVLPESIVEWGKIKDRPKEYSEPGDGEDGFMTQFATTKQFNIVHQTISAISERLDLFDNAGGIGGIKKDLFDHIADYNNPHRITPAQIGAISISLFNDHIQNFSNPHHVTPSIIGLGNVNNTSDDAKPISHATEMALEELRGKINSVLNDIDGMRYITNVTWSNSNGALALTFNDSNIFSVALPLYDIFNTITFDVTTKELVILLPNGSQHRINIQALIQNYSGSIGSHIHVTIGNDNVVKADIIPGSIGELEISMSTHLRGSPTTMTQNVGDRSTRISTTEFVKSIVINNLISYEVDRPLSANMGRMLNQRKADIDDVLNIIKDLPGYEVVDALDSTSKFAALSSNMGRHLDLTKAPRVHTSPSGETFGRATISLFGHVRASNVDPLMDGTVFRGTDDGYVARADHRHPTDITRAPIHSPNFTGEPHAPTPPDPSNDTRIATTEWMRRNAVGIAKGICVTSGSDVDKRVTLRSSFMEPPVFFLRQIGSTVAVTFRNEDRSGHINPTTLNVQGTGAAPILFGGFYMTNGMLGRGHTHIFTFDGDFWRLMNPVPGTGMSGTNGPGVDLWADECDCCDYCPDCTCEDCNWGAGGSGAPIIVTSSIPNGQTGAPFSFTLSSTGDQPITWSLSGGSLPTGLTLTTPGVISGTPVNVGTTSFTVKATNAKGSAEKVLSITISAGAMAPTITTTRDSVPQGVEMKPYSFTLGASGTPPITWEIVAGTLPDGLSLSANGVISGTPTITGKGGV